MSLRTCSHFSRLSVSLVPVTGNLYANEHNAERVGAIFAEMASYHLTALNTGLIGTGTTLLDYVVPVKPRPHLRQRLTLCTSTAAL